MVIHDPQEEEYAERASAESDKFDTAFSGQLVVYAFCL